VPLDIVRRIGDDFIDGEASLAAVGGGALGGR
jgi:hypothetical protein